MVFVPGGGFAGAVLRVVGHAADEFCGGVEMLEDGSKERRGGLHVGRGDEGWKEMGIRLSKRIGTCTDQPVN